MPVVKTVPKGPIFVAAPLKARDHRPEGRSVPPHRWSLPVGRLRRMAVPQKARNHGPGGTKCPAMPVVATCGAPAGDGCPTPHKTTPTPVEMGITLCHGGRLSSVLDPNPRGVGRGGPEGVGGGG